MHSKARSLATTMPDNTGLSTVNLAARQRMLSQRMVLQTVLAAQGDKAQLQAAERTLSLFCESQATLLQMPKKLDEASARKVEAVYHGVQGVGGSIQTFTKLVRTALDHIGQRDLGQARSVAQVVAHTDAVLEALNKVTTVFDDISKTQSDSMKRELSGIVSDIQNVAREAKVVSFNALVIAARAGQFGREFAVVANVLSGITGKIDGLSREAIMLAGRR
ncbi:type IV pili methyl-accepting chemotaxis transducer N-terminal domain-containing protein [Rhodoferax sp. WC2427]|uniref:type IV pili methyl-accepting chemotaxis transducer N-terminal domain-containing protein n=1 Tax=Rhodoferax sp. WC2427 TaxID=3234144 RepID=UPI00346642BC